MSNSQTFAPFKSGCGMCKPSTDYLQPVMHGSGSTSSKNYELSPDKVVNSYVTAHGGKKSTKSTKSTKPKKMKGGMETSGATSMNQRFFDPNAQLVNSPELLGNKTMSAYGLVESGDVGTGMLAPYSSSGVTGMKTGGAKKLTKSTKPTKSTKSKKMKGGKGTSGPIPNISSEPIKDVQTTIDSAITGFTDFMHKLDEDYLKSIEYIKSVKIGNQQLIQGGAKPVKKPIKKPAKKPAKKSVKKGGDGSDFALTANSRGPVNAPDDYWGVPGEQWFRQFNKTGEYIPNSKLAVAATPLLAGKAGNTDVYGFDAMNDDYGTV